MAVHDHLSAVPKRFYIDTEDQTVCRTVGELIAELQLLPQDLRIEQGFGEGVRVEIFNAMKRHGDPEDAHVQLTEND